MDGKIEEHGIYTTLNKLKLMDVVASARSGITTLVAGVGGAMLATNMLVRARKAAKELDVEFSTLEGHTTLLSGVLNRVSALWPLADANIMQKSKELVQELQDEVVNAVEMEERKREAESNGLAAAVAAWAAFGGTAVVGVGAGIAGADAEQVLEGMSNAMRVIASTFEKKEKKDGDWGEEGGEEGEGRGEVLGKTTKDVERAVRRAWGSVLTKLANNLPIDPVDAEVTIGIALGWKAVQYSGTVVHKWAGEWQKRAEASHAYRGATIFAEEARMEWMRLEIQAAVAVCREAITHLRGAEVALIAARTNQRFDQVMEAIGGSTFPRKSDGGGGGGGEEETRRDDGEKEWAETERLVMQRMMEAMEKRRRSGNEAWIVARRSEVERIADAQRRAIEMLHLPLRVLGGMVESEKDLELERVEGVGEVERGGIVCEVQCLGKDALPYVVVEALERKAAKRAWAISKIILHSPTSHSYHIQLPSACIALSPALATTLHLTTHKPPLSPHPARKSWIKTLLSSRRIQVAEKDDNSDDEGTSVGSFALLLPHIPTSLTTLSFSELTWASMVGILRGIVDGLVALRACGVVHTHLDPSSVCILREDGGDLKHKHFTAAVGSLHQTQTFPPTSPLSTPIPPPLSIPVPSPLSSLLSSARREAQRVDNAFEFNSPIQAIASPLLAPEASTTSASGQSAFAFGTLLYLYLSGARPAYDDGGKDGEVEEEDVADVDTGFGSDDFEGGEAGGGEAGGGGGGGGGDGEREKEKGGWREAGERRVSALERRVKRDRGSGHERRGIPKVLVEIDSESEAPTTTISATTTTASLHIPSPSFSLASIAPLQVRESLRDIWKSGEGAVLAATARWLVHPHPQKRLTLEEARAVLWWLWERAIASEEGRDVDSVADEDGLIGMREGSRGEGEGEVEDARSGDVATPSPADVLLRECLLTGPLEEVYRLVGEVWKVDGIAVDLPEARLRSFTTRLRHAPPAGLNSARALAVALRSARNATIVARLNGIEELANLIENERQGENNAATRAAGACALCRLLRAKETLRVRVNSSNVLRTLAKQHQPCDWELKLARELVHDAVQKTVYVKQDGLVALVRALQTPATVGIAAEVLGSVVLHRSIANELIRPPARAIRTLVHVLKRHVEASDTDTLTFSQLFGAVRCIGGMGTEFVDLLLDFDIIKPTTTIIKTPPHPSLLSIALDIITLILSPPFRTPTALLPFFDTLPITILGTSKYPAHPIPVATSSLRLLAAFAAHPTARGYLPHDVIASIESTSLTTPKTSSGAAIALAAFLEHVHTPRLIPASIITSLLEMLLDRRGRDEVEEDSGGSCREKRSSIFPTIKRRAAAAKCLFVLVKQHDQKENVLEHDDAGTLVKRILQIATGGEDGVKDVIETLHLITLAEQLGICGSKSTHLAAKAAIRGLESSPSPTLRTTFSKLIASLASSSSPMRKAFEKVGCAGVLIRTLRQARQRDELGALALALSATTETGEEVVSSGGVTILVNILTSCGVEDAQVTNAALLALSTLGKKSPTLLFEAMRRDGAIRPLLHLVQHDTTRASASTLIASLAADEPSRAALVDHDAPLLLCRLLHEGTHAESKIGVVELCEAIGELSRDRAAKKVVLREKGIEGIVHALAHFTSATSLVEKRRIAKTIAVAVRGSLQAKESARRVGVVKLLVKIGNDVERRDVREGVALALEALARPESMLEQLVTDNAIPLLIALLEERERTLTRVASATTLSRAAALPATHLIFSTPDAGHAFVTISSLLETVPSARQPCAALLGRLATDPRLRSTIPSFPTVIPSLLARLPDSTHPSFAFVLRALALLSYEPKCALQIHEHHGTPLLTAIANGTSSVPTGREEQVQSDARAVLDAIQKASTSSSSECILS